jgi:hypothetical protein
VAPHDTPISTLTTLAVMPMASEIRQPHIRRTRRSRPRPSVPNQWAAFGGWYSASQSGVAKSKVEQSGTTTDSKASATSTHSATTAVGLRCKRCQDCRH